MNIYNVIILEALESAALVSAQNIEGFYINTRVLLASDLSGSMFVPVSPKSSIENADIGVLLSSMLRSRCQSVIAGAVHMGGCGPDNVRDLLYVNFTHSSCADSFCLRMASR